MLFSRLVLILPLFLFGEICLAAPFSTCLKCITPPRPSNDPWYLQTDEELLSQSQPGRILSTRQLEVPSAFAQYAAAAWQIKFRTTDGRDRPTWAVTTLYFPKALTNSARLVSYQQPYDSAEVDQGPSYAVYHSNSQLYTTLFPAVWAFHSDWFINMPDYEGPSAMFGAGRMAGHATLDSIRAAQEMLRTTIPTAMWGYSGGALATEWAVALHGSYASNLNITAAVMGGLTPNMTSVFYTVSQNTTYSYLIPEVIRGLAAQYPEIMDDIRVATDWATSETATASENATAWDNAIDTLKTAAQSENTLPDLLSYTQEILDQENVKLVMMMEGQMSAAGGITQIPLFVHHAAYDEVAPIQDVRALLRYYCGRTRGVPIYFQTNISGTGRGMHIQEGVNGVLPTLLNWLPDAFAGNLDPYSDGCPMATET